MEEAPRTCWNVNEEPWKEALGKGAIWTTRVKQGRIWTVRIDRPPGVRTFASPLALKYSGDSNSAEGTVVRAQGKTETAKMKCF